MRDEIRWGQKTPMPYWAQTHLAAILGLSNVMLGRFLNGVSYPSLKTMQKFEYVFGWPLTEQVTLIPPYWEWPDQGTTTRQGERKRQENPTDLRYAIKLQAIISEWGAANPRTETLKTLRLHPALEAKNRYGPGGPQK